jgi:transcriptional regulator GlxA family with amidase domain
VTGLSERTLRYVFELELGISPVRLARRVRLERAHKALVSADPAKTSVTQVAQRFGFEDLPLFSLSYSKTFNEPPSKTLRSRAKPRLFRSAARAPVRIPRNRALILAAIRVHR